LADLVVEGSVRLFDVQYGKYAGRVVAKVMTVDGRDVAERLVSEGHARPYSGRRREAWCTD